MKPDATVTNEAGLACELATVKRQCDAACRDLATVTAELHKFKTKNDELRSGLAVLCDSFQVPPSS